MNLSFENQVALVTCAGGSGLGLATAKASQKAGASVALGDNHQASVRAAAEELVAAGQKALTIQSSRGSNGRTDRFCQPRLMQQPTHFEAVYSPHNSSKNPCSRFRCGEKLCPYHRRSPRCPPSSAVRLQRPDNCIYRTPNHIVHLFRSKDISLSHLSIREVSARSIRC
jgi:short chain dehydrogenase